MKNKDYYFSHDYNPTNDPKIVCLLGNFGGLGYGVYWRIIELLHQEENNKLPLKKYIYEAIAKQMLANAQQIEAIINECLNTYELFISDGEFFWSNRVLSNVKRQEEISNIRSIAGKAGAIAKQNVANVSKTRNKIKENKIKINNININIPTLEEVKKYCEERKNKVIPEQFIDFYSAKGWLIGKNKIKDWRAAIRNWERSDEAKSAPNNIKILHDGTRAILKFGQWVDFKDNSVKIDTHYYPEITK